MNPDDYAIIIGLQTYPGLSNLAGPENDARAFRDWVVSPTGGGVPDDSHLPGDPHLPNEEAIHLQLILSSNFKPFTHVRNAHPVVSEIQNAFLKLYDIYSQNSESGKGTRIGRRLYIYMAGHGIAPSASRAVNQYESALLMADARSLFYGSSYHIPGAYTANWFSINGCFDEIFLFMDCCRADESVLAINEFLPDDRGENAATRCYMFSTKWAKNAREKTMTSEGGTVVVRGVFTKTLLDGLSGGATVPDPKLPGQGIITVSSLKGYVYDNIGKVMASPAGTVAESPGVGITESVDIQEPDIDYYPRRFDGTDIVILRVPAALPPVAAPVERALEFPQPHFSDPHKTPPEAVIPEERDAEISQQPVTLEVKTGDEATEIFVLNDRFGRVGRAVGNQARFTLPPGVYSVKVKSGDTQQKYKVDLQANQTITFEPAVFSSPSPLEGTAKTHEFQVYNAADHSRQTNKTLGAGSELYVFVRDWTAENRPAKLPANKTVEQPATGLTIRNLAGEVLVDLASDEFPGENRWDPWKACNVVLDPGTYLLTLEKPNGDLIQQTIMTCRGWQTQVFLLLKGYGKGRNKRRADLSNASIYMAELGKGFNPFRNTEENATARLTELARRGLVNNRRVLTEPTLREVLNSKFANPMLGIMGGHLLLLEEKVNHDLLKLVVGNLRGLLGRSHPDVEALAIQAGIGSDYRFDAPPMLLPSWSVLLRSSATDPQLIPGNSLANEVSDKLWGGFPWLLWTVPNQITAKDAAVRNQQLQQQLNRVVAAQEATYGSMESMGVDRDAHPAEPVGALSDEQLSRLVQTMGLPRCKIEQLVKDQQ